MSDTAIQLSGVSKRYRLRHGWYVSSIKDEVGRLTARFLGRPAPHREDFWALRDITFSLKQGEALGLIGMNGAGKSTLLKILSKVTVPTAGTFETRGRLGSLIEIGAGFHPDLTGRENIFLNGSIMGMRRQEVQRKFDQIVAFAEVERFIDTPIKFYSSGMQMRLGFAVAAHTDPDVLLIDEILAVGDASFQAKCLNKLSELKEQEKTIVIVSHQLTNIVEHSTTVLWLDHGAVRMLGETDEVVDAYLDHVSSPPVADDSEHGVGNPISLVNVTMTDARGNSNDTFDREDAAHIDITYTAARALPGAAFGVSFYDVHGNPLGGVVTDPDSVKVTAPVDQDVLRLTLNPLVFNKGAYMVDVSVLDRETKHNYVLRRRVLRFFVDGHRASSRESIGHVYYPHQWEQIK